ncbi:hypothetical protein [Maribacter aestuarii]|uniref:hypothetical protein n=1 Tax=Maribacter aestuarii TaxID=1130723 RepID=UPI00248BF85D|nr:hypothetical protein [Maribacter aestuarii]
MKTILITALYMSTFVSFSQEKLTINDFNDLLGDKWTGQLTYQSYSGDGEMSIPTNARFQIEEGQLIKITEYPEEPHANSREEWKISQNPYTLNNEPILRVESSKDGSTIIQTEFMGEDKDREARMIREIYFNKRTLEITKHVEIIETGERFIRNKFSYIR